MGFNELLFIHIYLVWCVTATYDKLLSLPSVVWKLLQRRRRAQVRSNEAVACNKMTVQTLNKDNIFLHSSICLEAVLVRVGVVYRHRCCAKI